MTWGLVWTVRLFKIFFALGLRIIFTRLAMRTEEGRAGTGSVPLFPLSARWIVPLWLQPSWLVSVTLQVWEPSVPTKKYTRYYRDQTKMSFWVSRRGATFCFRKNVYFWYNLAKLVKSFGEKWENETVSFKPNRHTKSNRTPLVWIFNHSQKHDVLRIKLLKKSACIESN
jgi:hypothetical protein